MIRRPTEKDFREWKEIWQLIDIRMIDAGISPEGLASKTRYNLSYIKRGISGEPISITDDFLRDVVTALNLVSSRATGVMANSYLENASREELIALLRLAPTESKHQSDFLVDWGC